MKNILYLVLFCAVHASFAQVAETDPAFLTGTGFNGRVNALAIQSDGKILVGGDFSSYNGVTRNNLARLNSDGTLDNTFNANAAMSGSVLGIAIDANNGIVCVGSMTGSIKRVSSTGVADGMFTLAGTGLNGVVYAVAIQADGNIVIAGSFTSYNGTSRNGIARLSAFGALDGTFNPGTGLNGFARKVAIQSDGKIIVVGGSSGFSTYNGTSRDNIVRIESSGAIDAGFVPPTNLLARMYDIKLQSDDKIIVTGEYNGNVNSIFNGIARLNTNGSMDNTFTPNFIQGGRSILIQADGKIVIGGIVTVSYLPLGYKRLNANGTTDNFAVGDGFVRTSSPEVNALVAQDGKILAGGDFDSFNGDVRAGIARITSCPSVAISTQPVSITRCQTNNVTFSVVATGTGLGYKWQVKASGQTLYSDLSNGGGVSGVATSTLTLSSITGGMAGNSYRCVVSDATCSSTSSAAVLSVPATPSITIHPDPQTKCEGLNASFTVTASNPGGIYQWQENAGSGFVNIVQGGIYSGVMTATLTLTGVPVSKSGYSYRCVLGTCDPSIISNSALLTVTAVPAITAQPQNIVSTCTGTNAQFAITATGATSYQWQEKIGAGSFANISDGGIYSGTSTATLVLTGLTVTQNGNQYRCIASGSCDATSSAGALVVYAAPTFSAHPANSTKCVSGTAIFTVGLTVAPVGITYQWQEKIGAGSYTNIANGGIYSGATTSSLTITGVTIGMDGNKYRCVAGTCNPSATSFEADLTVFNPFVVSTQPAAVTACPNANATFTVAGNGDGTITYQWQEQLFGGSFVNINNGTTNGVQYSGATTNTLTLTNVTSVVNNSRYRCTISNGVCSAFNTNTAQLTVPSTVTINTQPTALRTLCGTGNTTFSFTVNQTTVYQWQVNTGTGFVDILNEGVYSGANTTQLTITGATVAHNGNKYRCKLGTCPAIQQFTSEGTLTVNSPPEVSLQPVAKTICSGETTTFKIEATGTLLTYQWLKDGSNISGSVYTGETTPVLTITGGLSNLDKANYSCRVSGAAGCPPVESNAGKLTVNQITVIAHPSSNTPVCEGTSVGFAVDASGPGLTYQWQASSGSSFTNIANSNTYNNVTTASMSVINAPFNMNGLQYRCVVSGGCPAVNSGVASLRLKAKPSKPVITASVTGNSASPILTAAPGDQFTWYKDGTQTGTGGSLTITSEGSYTVFNRQEGCDGSLSDPKIIVVTGDIATSEAGLRMYPNPAATHLIISLADFNPGRVDITLVDVLGRAVENVAASGGGDTEVSVTRFQPGRYAVVLQQGSKKVVSHFIKSN